MAGRLKDNPRYVGSAGDCGRAAGRWASGLFCGRVCEGLVAGAGAGGF